MSRTVAIHQPNFFPWLGYFDKIRQSDCFVFLNDVLVIKTGGSWFNRVMIPKYDNSAGMWITVPTQRPSGFQQINQVVIVDYPSWREKFTKTLQNRYAKAPYKKEITDLILTCTESADGNLSSMNIRAIKLISKELGLTHCEFILSSDLKTDLTGTARLVNITNEVEADIYLCGGGSEKYFEERLFFEAGKNVRYQSFKSPVYTQDKNQIFLPGMSVIDLLMNVGIGGAKDIFAR